MSRANLIHNMEVTKSEWICAGRTASSAIPSLVRYDIDLLVLSPPARMRHETTLVCINLMTTSSMDTVLEVEQLSIYSVIPHSLSCGSGIRYDQGEIRAEVYRPPEDDEDVLHGEDGYNHRIAAAACVWASCENAAFGIYSVYHLARALGLLPPILPGQVVRYPDISSVGTRWLPRTSDRLDTLSIDFLDTPLLIRIVGLLVEFHATDGHGMPLSYVNTYILPVHQESRSAAKALLDGLSDLPDGMDFLDDDNIPVHADCYQHVVYDDFPEHVAIKPFDDIVDSRYSTNIPKKDRLLHHSEIEVGDLVCQYVTVVRCRVYTGDTSIYWRAMYRLRSIYLLAKRAVIPPRQFM
ncbi:hypothetical protein BV25DRAFT_1838605 [Artomyces pyxidatus]|uniref:Uncharacterized protein n=1 Tax=Artomyces pyxidatus TaxID=48021 RepID=A0ACB8T0T0_9AGAM|nr:hypothetical protein BV25DRAFT_1838605 [Artomyces pyxidatus]